MLLSIVRGCALAYTSIIKLEKSLFLIMFLSHQTWKSTLLPCKLMHEEKHFTPWCSLKHGKRHFDHCAIKLCMNMKAFEQKQASEKIKVWNFNDPDCWEKLINLQNPQLFSVIWGKLVTILKLITKNGKTT